MSEVAFVLMLGGIVLIIAGCALVGGWGVGLLAGGIAVMMIGAWGAGL